MDYFSIAIIIIIIIIVLLSIVMKYYYYYYYCAHDDQWVTFAPLSRGSAACGYAALQSVLLCGGKWSGKRLPRGKQLDWEAILSPSCDVFIGSVRDWFLPLEEDHRPGHLTSSEGEEEEVFGCINTIRDMIDVLCMERQQKRQRGDES